MLVYDCSWVTTVTIIIATATKDKWNNNVINKNEVNDNVCVYVMLESLIGHICRTLS